MANVLVPLFFFLFLGAVTLVPLWMGSQARLARLDLAREALNRGQTLDPELIRSLVPDRDPHSNARRNLIPGVILTMLALGLAGASFLAPDGAQQARGMMMAALIVGSIGCGFLILTAFERIAARKKPSER